MSVSGRGSAVVIDSWSSLLNVIVTFCRRITNTFICQKQTIRTGTIDTQGEEKIMIKHSEKKKHNKTLMTKNMLIVYILIKLWHNIIDSCM